VQISGAASNNIIGGTTEDERNVISGNSPNGTTFSGGVFISGSAATQNVVQGNYIGTNANGTAPLGNFDGVLISGARNNTIGGTVPGARNVISGNKNDGVEIFGSGATGNKVQGNYIGTDKTGAANLGNTGAGVSISGAINNTIGGTTPAARNIISGNGAGGVQIFSGATGNQVQGNYIGTDVMGTQDLGNATSGVIISSANNTIGGTTSGARNIISGNGKWGISIGGTGATGNMVQGNFIGTDFTGTQAIGNNNANVDIANGASFNIVGGTTPEARNIISGGRGDGVLIEITPPSTDNPGGNKVQGNYIGTDVTGMVDLGNGGDGVTICRASNNTIGGTVPGAGNVISGNNDDGITIVDSSATGNVVQGNLIGTTTGGTSFLGNSDHGVFINQGASNNTIGGTSVGEGNVIAGNSGHGVVIFGGSATRNKIQRNSIFGNGQLGIDLGFNGVTLNDPGDGDTGPNNLQNSPEMTEVDKLLTGELRVVGRVETTPGSTGLLTLEFFLAAPDPSEYGEGQTFLGSFQVPPGSFDRTFTPAASVNVGNKVTATATDNQGNTSEFALNVSVDPGDEPPPPPASNSITVVVPNRGENWQIGTTQTIQWTSTGSIANVKIELSRNGAGGPFETLFASTPNDGSQSWTMSGPATTNGFIKISDAADAATSDTSNSAFTISDPPPATSITMLVPNGGENWQINTSQTITWTSSGVTGNVKIELSRNGGATFETLFADTPNDGSQSWTVTGPATTQARVKISSVANPSVNDLSNANFTLSDPPPPASITVTVPNGPENWQLGTSKMIQWTSQGVTGNVKIELSRDGGSTFEMLFASTANDGSEPWTVTGTATVTAKVRVFSVNDPTVNDLSDLNFAITGNSGAIIVTSPDGGEVWGINTVHTITWTSSGVTGNVRIRVSRDGGQTYSQIAQTANTGSFQWTVTGPASSQCRIAVQSVNDPAVGDISNTLFTIQ
jgi:hypothetical protein